MHGVGMDEDAVIRFRSSGAALVWCPTSNRFLFGRTAPQSLLVEGIDVLLGSDSRLTGDGDLLDEIRLRAGRWACWTTDGWPTPWARSPRAAAWACPSHRWAGSRADLIVVRQPVLDACAEDVLLVLVDGARVAHPALKDQPQPVRPSRRRRPSGPSSAGRLPPQWEPATMTTDTARLRQLAMGAAFLGALAAAAPAFAETATEAQAQDAPPAQAGPATPPGPAAQSNAPAQAAPPAGAQPPAPPPSAADTGGIELFSKNTAIRN